ncbi:Bacteriophage SP-beta, YorD [uncultured Caudovirales phage]|uniref:Bacteriophage SP-beta, YorD n=1 Tax=uncultured Caudovirales phage TaxID=2100421 RepID=A0A6J5RWF3_9CAUD|nr:Bacteriophage SP-beta, YorD [uncultured Caudovirales phage]
MNLYERIMSLYPELKQEDFFTTIRLQNDSDGKGDYIKEWNHTLPKPTDEQLTALETE